MFKKVTSTPGFWKSVFSLAIAFAVLFTVVKWVIEGFKMSFFTEKDLSFYLVLALSGFIYGFFVTFGKFRTKIKEQENRK